MVKVAKDSNDSVKVVVDDDGIALSKYEYLPYGETWFQEDAEGYEDQYAPKYNSQELDKESGYYFYNARHYDGEISRFVTPDTVIPNEYDTQSWNRYMYVKGNPIMYRDPTGHEERKSWSEELSRFGDLGAALGSIIDKIVGNDENNDITKDNVQTNNKSNENKNNKKKEKKKIENKLRKNKTDSKNRINSNNTDSNKVVESVLAQNPIVLILSITGCVRQDNPKSKYYNSNMDPLAKKINDKAIEGDAIEVKELKDVYDEIKDTDYRYIPKKDSNAYKIYRERMKEKKIRDELNEEKARKEQMEWERIKQRAREKRQKRDREGNNN